MVSKAVSGTALGTTGGKRQRSHLSLGIILLVRNAAPGVKFFPPQRHLDVAFLSSTKVESPRLQGVSVRHLSSQFQGHVFHPSSKNVIVKLWQMRPVFGRGVQNCVAPRPHH